MIQVSSEQDSFMKLLKHPNKYFKDWEHVKAWLLRVTVNNCNDLHRRRKRHPEDMNSLLEELKEAERAKMEAMIKELENLGLTEQAKAEEERLFVTWTLNDNTTDESIVNGRYIRSDQYYTADKLAELNEALSSLYNSGMTIESAGSELAVTDEYNGVTYHAPVYDTKISGLNDFVSLFKSWIADGASRNSTTAQRGEAASPGGAEFVNYGWSTLFMAHISPKRVEAARADANMQTGVSYTKEYDTTLIVPGYYTYNDSSDGEQKIVYCPYDVIGYSFALYEDIQDIPDIKFSVYGVTEADIQPYLYTNGDWNYIDYDIESAYSDHLAGADTMTKMGSWDIDKSGVYYVDYTAFFGS